MATKTWSGAVYPIGSAGFDVPARMLEMANSLNPVTVPHFATKSARNTAANDLPAGHRAVCWVDGGVGLCGYNGTAWINLSPEKRYSIQHSYGSGAVAAPGDFYLDPAPLSIPGVFNGQTIDVDIQASVRVDGSARQTVAVGVAAANALQATNDPSPEMVQIAAAGTNDEYRVYPRKISFYCNTGTVTLAPALFAGGGPRLVMNQVTIWAKLYPLDAA